jgi:hypothetical protein
MAGKEKENMKRKGKQRLVGEMAIRWFTAMDGLPRKFVTIQGRGSEKTPPLRPVRRLRRLAARNSIFISIFFEIRFLSMLHKNSQLNIKSAGGMCAGAVCLGGGERGRDDTPLLSDHPDGLPACCAQAHVLSPDDSAQED